jgi:anti-sigma factor RsiW
MINCDGVRMQAPLYLSGEMEADDWDAFVAHLARCPICAAKLAEDRAIDSALRSVLGEFSPDTGRLELVVRQKIAVDRRRRRWAGAAVLAAAAALLTVTLIAWRDRVRPPRWYADAALDHRKEVVEVQPRRWRSSPLELAQLAEQNGLHLSQAAGMAMAGYRLERAKVCTISGQRMLHLVFSNGARSYSIFVAPHLARRETSRPVREGVERVTEFNTGHFRGLVVAANSAEECAEFARVALSQL